MVGREGGGEFGGCVQVRENDMPIHEGKVLLVINERMGSPVSLVLAYVCASWLACLSQHPQALEMGHIESSFPATRLSLMHSLIAFISPKIRTPPVHIHAHRYPTRSGAIRPSGSCLTCGQGKTFLPWR